MERPFGTLLPLPITFFPPFNLNTFPFTPYLLCSVHPRQWILFVRISTLLLGLSPYGDFSFPLTIGIPRPLEIRSFLLTGKVLFTLAFPTDRILAHPLRPRRLARRERTGLAI